MSSPFEESVARAAAALEQAKLTRDEPRLIELSLELGKALLDASTIGAEPEERARTARLGALMRDRAGQVFATALTDRVHRSTSGARLVSQVRQLIDAVGVPKSLTRWDRLELRALQIFGASAPELTARAVRRRIHEDASPYIVPADPAALDAFLAKRRAQHVRVNVNHLGEEVLGKADEERYLEQYISLLERPEVDTISVKLSSIDCRLDVLAWETTLDRLAGKLERIYQAALDNQVRRDGALRPKLVYLDMESYRELELTFALFRRVLEIPRFRELSAGIVLQAYLPDSFGFQKELVAWARERVAAGGAAVRMRLVKGANLMLERIEASLRGFELAPYGSKHEVDANFKRMLRFGLVPEHARAVHLGFGSHNLFDIAYALVLRAAAGLEHEVEPEMLEGMADPLRRVVERVVGRVLVYAPSVSEREFSSAVAYLVRRLDENTSHENFLRHSFEMRSGDATFAHEKQRFLAALGDAERVGAESHRRQNRSEAGATPRRAHFANEPDTDFTRAENRAWLAGHLERRRALAPVLVSRVAGKALSGSARDGFDPSRPGVVPYTYAALDSEGVRRAIELGDAGRRDWASLPGEEREAVLLGVAEALRRARGELVAAMVLDAGKRALEADAEVSEAIDFAEYYARQHARLRERFDLAPKGLVVVTPPWNFPLAIGLGSALAALVAGNTVLLKPPPEALLVLSRAAELCWGAGVDERALGLVLVDDEHASMLVTDARVDAVMLTGGTETARRFQTMRPRLHLCAETGGKNAIIVSAMSDREQAILHVVQSAFGYAGQKCSACSLLILEREVYRSASFRRQLADAVASLPVGSAWRLDSVVTPLIRPPSGPLARALAALDARESWLVAPTRAPDNERLVGPGVRYGVEPGSFAHTTELFGPVLSVLEARDLGEAIELANATPYGLTSGLQSLDAQEQTLFLETMEAGNLYVNRPITGAIVGRQPFGGRKASACGRGFKVGGPNTLLGLSRVVAEHARSTTVALSLGPRQPTASRDAAPNAPAFGARDAGAEPSILGRGLDKLRQALHPAQREPFERRLLGFAAAADAEILRAHPQDHVLGHRDELVYRPCRVLIAAGPETTELELLTALFAAELAGARIGIFVPEAAGRFSEFEALGAVRYASAGELGDELVDGRYERFVYLDAAPADDIVELARLVSRFDAGAPHEAPYVELLRYVTEQSRSIAWHRHGNLALAETMGVRRTVDQ